MASTSTAFSLRHGDSIKRSDLHEAYGGRRQGGISPSKVTPNVFLFTDPRKGHPHGYLYDGWRDDGLCHYTGEGQYGVTGPRCSSLVSRLSSERSADGHW